MLARGTIARINAAPRRGSWRRMSEIWMRAKGLRRHVPHRHRAVRTLGPLGSGRSSRREIRICWSAGSALEISIKYALGRPQLPVRPADYVPNRLQQTRTSALPITHDHALRCGELPPHHRDPFDRILIAQAQIERLPFVTADRRWQPTTSK